MSQPQGASPAETEEARSPYWKFAVWIAIGALIAAALVCVIWVLIGDQNGLIGRAFLTIVLLAGFAGAALLDASVAPRRPQWYVLVSMIGWVLALLAGAIKIWAPMDGGWPWDSSPFIRFIEFVGIVLVLRLAILHIRLFTKTQGEPRSAFPRAVVPMTVVLVTVLAVLLILPMLLARAIDFSEFYWRVVVAITILAAVGTALVPLVRALNGPRRLAPPAPPVPAPVWPTYVDGVTPLPALADGSPDWNAYYTGYPTQQAPYQQQSIAPTPTPTPPPMPPAPPAPPTAPPR
ncbi:MAG: hypothetical protein Q7T17_10520 [Microbacterium sp.]|uniref:hypothetical protein n=1 Tax=Microbacterium sp. TaxID=51671 RepID=UPI002726A111|nr:hypothetical protein [Microbacterium sp.]MDO8383397.1 hypothetical protein [Microbacterium sp.]